MIHWLGTQTKTLIKHPIRLEDLGELTPLAESDRSLRVLAVCHELFWGSSGHSDYGKQVNGVY